MIGKKRNQLVFVVAVLLASFIVIAGIPLKANAERLTVGSIMPLSGPISIVGMSWSRGFELFFDKVNEEGGVDIGGKKYTFKFISEDSKGAAEAASTAARKLIHQNGVKFIFAAILESSTEAVYEVCERNKAMQMIPSVNVPGHPSDVSPDKPFLFRPNINFDDTHTLDMDYMKEAYPNVKTMAIVFPSIGYEGMVKDLTHVAEQRGIKVVLAEEWEWGTTDFVPTYTRVLASKPDTVFAMVSGQTPHQLIAARQLGFKGPFIGNSPLGPEYHVQIAGPEICTDLISNGINPEDPTDAMREVIEMWNKKFREPFVSDAVMGWDEAWILTQAMQKAGSVDSEKVVAALDGMTTEGCLKTNFGPAYMGGKDRFGVNRVLKRPIPITHVMNGKMKLIGYRFGSHR
jgi:branched-chain amino acid transport system substrate-binding protein